MIVHDNAGWEPRPGGVLIMPDFRICASVLLRRPLSEIFEFFALTENLNLLTPPWIRFSVITPLPIHMAVGTVIKYWIKLRGLPIMWESEITEWNPPFGFTDTQIRGPYKRWVHRHLFEETLDGTLVTDDVSYRVLGGALVNHLFVSRELKKVFDYRTAKLHELYP